MDRILRLRARKSDNFRVNLTRIRVTPARLRQQSALIGDHPFRPTLDRQWPAGIVDFPNKDPPPWRLRRRAQAGGG